MYFDKKKYNFRKKETNILKNNLFFILTKYERNT